MHLYLVQHGEAKREGDDPERGLTEKGFLDVGAVASHIAQIPVSPVRICHSGKTRARQTASVFADLLKPDRGVQEVAALGPTDDPEAWRRLLLEMEEDVMLVGHLPHLSRLAGLLLTGDKSATLIDFRMGGVVSLKKAEPPGWRVEWMIIPETVRF